METATLAKLLTGVLARHLAQLADQRAGPHPPGSLEWLWFEQLEASVSATAVGRAAVRELSRGTSNPGAQRALRARLAVMLGDDEALASIALMVLTRGPRPYIVMTNASDDEEAGASAAAAPPDRRSGPIRLEGPRLSADEWDDRPAAGGPADDGLKAGYGPSTARGWLDEDEPDDPWGSSLAVGVGGQPHTRPAFGAESSDEEGRWLRPSLDDPDPRRPELATLTIEVDVTGPGATLDERGLFADGARRVDLDVYLTSRDFQVLHGGPYRLAVPRTGPSLNVARFDLVAPERSTTGTVTVHLFKANNFVQSMDVALALGGRPSRREITSVESAGRALGGAPSLHARQQSLVIRRAGDRYELCAFGVLRAEAPLSINPWDLNRVVGGARSALRDIAHAPDVLAGDEISPERSRELLAGLAKAGILLFRTLFGESGSEAARFADGLRSVTQTLRIQVVSDTFLVPWGLLYLGDSHSPDGVDPGLFLGARHIVENILRRSPPTTFSDISTTPRLDVLCTLNEDIDTAMGIDKVSEQRAFWENLRARSDNAASEVQVRTCWTADQVSAALDDPTDEQLWYFYCHAVNSPEEGSYLTLSGGSRLGLDDLKTGRQTPLPGSPLVLLNACGSANLGPLFYDGFLPYFLGRGARGMVGTECDVPAVFGAEWARRFFTRFLAGDPVGEVLLDVRRDFLERDLNPLGLAYSLYCDADLAVTPGLLMA